MPEIVSVRRSIFHIASLPVRTDHLLAGSRCLGPLLISILLPPVNRVQRILTRSVRKADKIAVVADGVSALITSSGVLNGC